MEIKISPFLNPDGWKPCQGAWLRCPNMLLLKNVLALASRNHNWHGVLSC